MATEAQRNAVKRYKEKNKGIIKRFTVDFSPNEQELWERIQAQPKKQTYIKDLIKADIARGRN